MATRKIYWIGWARRVGEVTWHEAVHVYTDDQGSGWRWLEKHWPHGQIQAHSIVMLRVGETPYIQTKKNP